MRFLVTEENGTYHFKPFPTKRKVEDNQLQRSTNLSEIEMCFTWSEHVSELP